MRASNFHFATTRETPADAEIASHRLMLRAGMIRKLGAGIYTWTPLGLRVLQRVERIVREEMNRAGALEMLMPAIQPAELWQETGRWDDFGPLLLKIRDRGEREFVYGPTHEEVITELARDELRSYRQLPLILYQIQTKFRDEIRPRFGVMRAREFIMKDAYSFDIDEEGMAESYERMRTAYERVFTRLGLDFRAVRADSGAIGGSTSHEFQVLAASGEDAIAVSSDGHYAANVELAPAVTRGERPAPAGAAAEPFETPGRRTIAELCEGADFVPEDCIKTLVVQTASDELIALCLRGDHELNETKLSKLEPLAAGFSFASAERIESVFGAEVGSIGPVGCPISVVVDRAASLMGGFVCGANQSDTHLRNVHWERDARIDMVEDIRNVVAGDPCPEGDGTLEIVRGIEVGHIFQLGTKYSEAMGAYAHDPDGKAQPLQMGCYGIGVSRIVAAAIEQNHDQAGIIWPEPIAPFQIVVAPINPQKSQRVRETAEELYLQFQEADIDVLLDDRGLRPGVMFSELELIGIPHRVVVSDRHLDADQVEYRARIGKENEMLSRDTLLETLEARLSQT